MLLMQLWQKKKICAVHRRYLTTCDGIYNAGPLPHQISVHEFGKKFSFCVWEKCIWVFYVKHI
jgi:hypothetical protein